MLIASSFHNLKKSLITKNKNKSKIETMNQEQQDATTDVGKQSKV